MKRVEIGRATLYLADCRDALADIDPETIDSAVVDPPYGLSFMNAAWDYEVPQADIWAAVAATLKPGAHLLSFFSPRTYHRGAVQIEDAGFDIRDQAFWMFGTGFPKTKASLKPAHEPIVVARKPFKGSMTANVAVFGTGAPNIDACRIPTDDRYALNIVTQGVGTQGAAYTKLRTASQTFQPDAAGRWPANVLHDGSETVTAVFPSTGPSSDRPRHNSATQSGSRSGADRAHTTVGHSDPGGSASRYFYCAKASRADRDEGLDGLPLQARSTMGSGIGAQPDQTKENNRNPHPTVKPHTLMRYLVRLATPVGGTVLDPFMGSGSTGKAAMVEDMAFVGVERDPMYFDIAVRRIAAAQGLDVPTY